MRRRAPWYVWLLALLLVLPAGSMPELLARLQAGDTVTRTYVLLYPVALVASAWYAVAGYRQRPLLSWIMLAFMAAITASVFYLVLS